jgi:hypothetical protein
LNLERCLGLEIPPSHGRLLVSRPERTRSRRPRARAIRKAIIQALEAEGGELQVMLLHARVECLLADPVRVARFRDYVNEQSRGKHAILERAGYGRYRLRQD